MIEKFIKFKIYNKQNYIRKLYGNVFLIILLY